MPTFSVEAVLDALAAQTPKSSGGGRVIMLVGAQRKQGVTTAARAVAHAVKTGAVYAIDLDLKRNAFAKTLSADGALGAGASASFGGYSLYALRSPLNAPVREAVPAFTFHRVGSTRIHAGVFDARRMPAGARLAISSAPDYWNAIRSAGAAAVVDAPSIDRSQLALRVAPHMDGVVLVVGDERGVAPAAIKAKAALDAAGANVIGIIYSGASAPVMAIERLARQLG